jgi:hypothetical protein
VGRRRSDRASGCCSDYCRHFATKTGGGRSPSVASVWISAWFRDTLNIFVGLQRCEKDTASSNSYCMSQIHNSAFIYKILRRLLTCEVIKWGKKKGNGCHGYGSSLSKSQGRFTLYGTTRQRRDTTKTSVHSYLPQLTDGKNILFSQSQRHCLCLQLSVTD